MRKGKAAVRAYPHHFYPAIRVWYAESMNKKSVIIAAACTAVAVVLVAHLASTEAALLTRFLGKSAWFLPYAALVAAVRELRLAR